MAIRVQVGHPIQVGPRLAFRQLLRTYNLAPGEKLLPVRYARQEQGNWCWAACCEMLRGLLRKAALPQCQIAEMRFAGNCCQNGSSRTCDQASWPHEAYPSHGIQARREQRILSPAELRAELGANRAVQVYFLWDSGLASHVALVVGYYQGDDFEVFDSSDIYGPGRRSYDHIVTAYGFGAWRLTYFEIVG